MDGTELDLEVYAGALIASRFRLLRLLGKGGMGVVWLAEDLRTATRVTLKFQLRKTSLPCRREAELLGRLDHRHIARLVDVGETNQQRCFLVLEYVPGTTLAGLLRSEGCMSYRMVATVAAQLGRALEHVHAKGIIHRDIKPQNVVVNREPAGLRVVLIDFGVAVAMGSMTDGDTTTQAGTPGFMAPEQFLGVDIDARADQFALACTLFSLLTGKRPYEQNGLWAALSTTRPPLLTSIPAGAAAALARALGPTPEDRFPSTRSFVASFCAARGQLIGAGARIDERAMLSCMPPSGCDSQPAVSVTAPTLVVNGGPPRIRQRAA